MSYSTMNIIAYYRKYTLCRGSGGVSPREFSEFEVIFDAI